MLLFLALLAPAPAVSADAVLPRETIAATDALSYELLSWATEDGKPAWTAQMLKDGAAVKLAAGTQCKLITSNLLARPPSVAVIVMSGPATGRRLLVPREAVQRDSP